MSGFGGINHIDPSAGVVVFVLTLFVITILELLLSNCSAWAKYNHFSELYEKLSKELLQLGLISFLIFLIDSSGLEGPRALPYREVFEVAHMVVLFIAFAFVVQAFFLMLVGKYYFFYDTWCFL